MQALSYCHYNLVDDTLTRMFDYFQACQFWTLACAAMRLTVDAQSKHVGLISASPLSMGLLTRQGPPQWHPATAELRAACAAAAELCTARGTDIAELAIQYAVRQESICTTLVGMCSREQVRRNVACAAAAFAQLDLRTTQLLHDVAAVLAPVKNATWPSGLPENSVAL